MLILLLLLLIATTFAAVNAAAYGDHCPSTTCGNVTISYPFHQIPTSSSFSTSFCGYPGLALTCSYNYNNNSESIPTPILTLSIDSTYIVKHIDYPSHTVTLIDNDVVWETCPRVRHNLTVQNFPLTNRNLNLAFYYNCSVVDESIPAIGCLPEVEDNGVRKRSYVFVAGREPAEVEWARVCAEKVLAPAVVEESVNLGDLVGGFGEVMRLGFVLDWGVKEVECGKCEKFGGMCGFRRAEEAAATVQEEFVCYCKDGGQAALNCKRSKFSLPEALNFELV